MGLAMTTHLVEQGYTVHGFDVSEAGRKTAAEAGVTTYESVVAAIAGMESAPKTVWLMVPARYVDDVIEDIVPQLQAGDTIIDGGNSFFKDTIRRHGELMDQEIHYLDCGTSGGVEGARNGASLMVGGERDAVVPLEHIFTTLAAPDAYGHVGGSGAGHFVKMVHNGIEYGMMGAIAEGMNVLHEHKDGLEVDVCEALKPYEHGSIIESHLMTWLSEAYHTPGMLSSIAGKVPKGETEIEMEYLVEHEQVKVLAAALEQRKDTRYHPSLIGTLISAMRNKFGGHQTIKKGE